MNTESLTTKQAMTVAEAIRRLKLKLDTRKERHWTPGMSFSAEIEEVETLINAIELPGETPAQPAAYLLDWIGLDGNACSRVQLTPDLKSDPWLERLRPTVTPLYVHVIAHEPNGCPIHGECPTCRYERIAGDPQQSVAISAELRCGVCGKNSFTGSMTSEMRCAGCQTRIATIQLSHPKTDAP